MPGSLRSQPSARSQGFARGRTWPLYFDASVDVGALFGEADDEDGVGDPSAESRSAVLARLDRFLSVYNIVRNAVASPLDVIAAQHTLCLSWQALSTLPTSTGHPPDDVQPPFKSEEQKRPQLVLDCLAYLAHEDLLSLCPPPSRDPLHTADRLAARRLRLRLLDNVREKRFLSTPMCDLKADKIGRLVQVQGSVIRASSVRPYVESMYFVCPRCQERFTLPLVDGKYKPPDGCPARGCRVKNLTPERSSATTRDFQKVRLQETPEDSMAEFYGRVPRTVEVELLDDLVDSCIPGDSVQVIRGEGDR